MITANCASNLQSFFSERLPYAVGTRLEGDVVIFQDTFIRLLREAMTTGCMIKMSEDEVNLVNDFVAYQDTGITDTDIVTKLDEWLVKLVNCEDLPSMGDCTLTSVHTFTACGN